MKTLIIYYSQSGQTRKMAEMIQMKTGADICAIDTEKKYNEDMWKAWDEAQAETASGTIRDLKQPLPDITEYDTILLGGPVWGYTLANPMLSFMRQTDFTGKKVSAFWTFYDHDEKYDADSKKEAKGAAYVKGLSLPRSLTEKKLEGTMNAWIQSLS